MCIGKYVFMVRLFSDLKKKSVLWLSWPWLALGLVRTSLAGPFWHELFCDSGPQQLLLWITDGIWCGYTLLVCEMLGQLDWLVMFRNWVYFWLGFWYHLEMGERESSPPISKWNNFPWKLFTFSSKTWIVKLLPKTKRNFSVFKVSVLMNGWYGKEGVF